MENLKCCICGCPIKDNHPERKTSKDKLTCSRTCYYQRLREEGTWNKGKTWKEMYNSETLEKMETRINKKGEEHFNYNGQRIDTTIRNFINNPQTKNEKILEDLPKEKLIKIILKEKTHKEYAYQRKAFEKYGRKCAVCGETKGQIDIHHIDGNHNNNELSNLMVLCPKHHREIHKQK